MRYSRREFLAVAGAVAGQLGSLPLARAADPPSRAVPWLAEIQTPPATVPAGVPELRPLLVDRLGNPVDTRDAWKQHRKTIEDTWLDFLKPVPAERPEPKIEVLSEDRPTGVIRQLVRYESEPGMSVEGCSLKPAAPPAKRPGVVVLHSTVDYTIRQPAGLEGPPEKFFGLKLAQRGYVAFCPRCFLWQGEGNYNQRVERFQREHPFSLGMAKMLFDAQRGLDLLETIPEVDNERLGTVGHSLGAKEALYLAAFDPRVQVAVSSEGGIGLPFSNWDAPWYLGEKIHKDDFKLQHHQVLSLVAPRPFLLIGGDSADGARSWPYIEAVLPIYKLYGSQRPPVGLYNHGRGHAVPPAAERRIYEWFETYLPV